MRLTGARAADKDDVVGGLRKRQIGQLADEAMIHLRLLEVEAGQIPMHREAGRTRLVADGAYGPVGAFGFKQMLD